MTTPIRAFGQYIVTFEAEEEHLGMRQHFIKECGWTEGQFKRIRDFAWFTAEVAIWRAGKELAREYLGACCYKTEEDFYTTFECDYFSDMVHTCAEQVGDVELTAAVEQWRATMRIEA